MIPLSEITCRSMSGVIGKELLKALWVAPWGNASQKTISDLGVTIGTNPGSKRPRNEDRTAFAVVTALNHERYAVALVCDGVGGSEMGDVAATLAVATFLGELAHVRNQLPLNTLLQDIIRRVDDVVRTELKGRGMTTVCAVIASATGQIAAANVGDSRVYSWRPGAFWLDQVSIDDTIENELRDLSLKDASVLDARNLRGRLSQAIGETGRSSSDLRVVVFDDLADGVILATDGAWKGSEPGFYSIALNATSSSEAMKRILAFSSWTGGSDNASLIIIENLKQLGKKAGEDCQCESSSGAWASVWFCDTKLILHQSLYIESDRKIGSPLNERQRLSKMKRPKQRSKNPSKFSKTSSGAGEQLSLTVEDDVKKSDDVSPHVEISTDDDVPSL